MAALLGAVDVLAGVEAWRCSEPDLGRLVQAVEVAQRRLDVVAGAAAVDAFGRGLPAEALLNRPGSRGGSDSPRG